MQKIYVQMTLPSLKDNTAPLDRLGKALRRQTGLWPRAALADLAPFAQAIIRAGYEVTATLAPDEAGPVLVALEPSDTTSQPADPALALRAALCPPGLWGDEGLGVALDIGSTHLQASLHQMAGRGPIGRRHLHQPPDPGGGPTCSPAWWRPTSPPA